MQIDRWSTGLLFAVRLCPLLDANTCMRTFSPLAAPAPYHYHDVRPRRRSPAAATELTSSFLPPRGFAALAWSSARERRPYVRRAGPEFPPPRAAPPPAAPQIPGVTAGRWHRAARPMSRAPSWRRPSGAPSCPGTRPHRRAAPTPPRRRCRRAWPGVVPPAPRPPPRPAPRWRGATARSRGASGGRATRRRQPRHGPARSWPATSCIRRARP
mmetsp:Transcript_25817/g.83391  ORF Transcript_25817/g.83391 Transcript_25817/m.83391 type:complete len:213 (-) Transcript_25817:2798-3436(-)